MSDTIACAPSPEPPGRPGWLFGRRSWARWLLAVLLATYGFATIGASICDLDDTDDELLFRKGQGYVAGQFDADRDHPPLSALVGLLLAPAAGPSDVQSYRWGHAVLYVAGVGAAVAVLEAAGLGFGALLFALLAFATPTLKAMAALNVSDADVCVFLLLAALALYCRLESERPGVCRLAMGLAGFFVGLASTAKPSGLGYLPFLLAAPLLARRRAIIADAVLGTVAFGCAFWLSYLLDPGALRFYSGVLMEQRQHFAKGYPAIVFGQRFERGVWYFYLVYLLVKVPLPALAVVTFGWAFGLAGRVRQARAELVCLLLPALCLLAIFSAGSVQPGVRYVLPVLALAFLGAAIAIDRRLAQVQHGWRRAAAVAVAGLAAVLIATDAYALWSGSFLAYFNVLATNPTRQFAFSSIDWSQGIPHHLRSHFPPMTSLADVPVYDAFARDRGEPVYVVVGATALSGATADRAAVLARLRPRWTVAGYEIHALTPLQLLRVLGWSDLDREVLDCPPGIPGEAIERRVMEAKDVAGLVVERPTLVVVRGRKGPAAPDTESRRWLLPGQDAATAVAGIDATTEVMVIAASCGRQP